jgi:hypothetical protein
MNRANFIHSLRTTLCAALSLGLVACTGIDKDTVGDSESESDATGESATDTTGASASQTSGASDTDGSGSGGGTEGSASTTGDSSTGEDSTSTGEVSTSGTSGTSGSTGGQGDSIPESCEAACEVVYVCLVGEYDSMEACVAECVEETMPEEPSAECEAAVIGFNTCVAAGSCEDFDKETFCEAELDLMIEVCDFGGDECTVAVGGDSESCGIIEDCDDGSMELRCEGDSCLCLVDDEEVGSCKNDICVDELDPNGLYDKALSCCGFEF